VLKLEAFGPRRRELEGRAVVRHCVLEELDGARVCEAVPPGTFDQVEPSLTQRGRRIGVRIFLPRFARSLRRQDLLPHRRVVQSPRQIANDILDEIRERIQIAHEVDLHFEHVELAKVARCVALLGPERRGERPHAAQLRSICLEVQLRRHGQVLW